MKEFFESISKKILHEIHDDEVMIINFDAEVSNFVRLNHSKIRQAGNVKQLDLSLSLIHKGKIHTSSLRLSGNIDRDTEILMKSLNYLRREMPELSTDPYLLYSKKKQSSFTSNCNSKINNQEILQNVLDYVSNEELVGIYSSGNIYRGFANSFGQFNWHESTSFNFDWSLYNNNDKAIKQNYAGTEWDYSRFKKILDEGKLKLSVLDNKEIKLKPGLQRVYLSPSALNEIIDMMSWGGFSYKANKIGSSPLHLMTKGDKQLNEVVTITEDLSSGIAPNFHEDGFIKPEKIELIRSGQFNTSLISPRSALEYSVDHNAAEYYESPVSIEIKPGNIPDDKITEYLKDGIYISNLWYLNFSDKNNARVTGLTRFGCFEVKDGEFIGPINTMRFDETIYNILGDNLFGLTNNQDMLMDCSTYEGRSSYSSTLPGAIVDEFKMTL
ncbi:MAG: hypothetical protein CMD88_03540 [Gammaproteobacteria bacterium]|nr:hypothetical protein [Gammaproteobacteria bacterium]